MFLIDPNDVNVPGYRNVEVIKAGAAEGVEILKNKLLSL